MATNMKFWKSFYIKHIDVLHYLLERTSLGQSIQFHSLKMYPNGSTFTLNLVLIEDMIPREYELAIGSYFKIHSYPPVPPSIEKCLDTWKDTLLARDYEPYRRERAHEHLCIFQEELLYTVMSR